jgi:hypothetical protein
MPALVLTTLKIVFLVLLYLFVARAIRVIWLDLGGRAPKRAAPPVAAPVASPTRPAPVRTGPAKGRARSIVVTEEGSRPKTYPLSSEAITIGRAPECTVVIKDGYTSQMHTKIFTRDGQWHVMDLGSTNGTYLNRVKVSDPVPIAPGDEIRLGKTVVEVRK